MKRFAITIGILTALFALSRPLFAGEASSESTHAPAANYVTFNTYMFTICRNTVALSAQLGETDTKCASDLARSVKNDYEKAIKSVNKKGDVTSMLVKFRESMLNAAAGIQPMINERKINYEARQDKVEAELMQLANRIKMEL